MRFFIVWCWSSSVSSDGWTISACCLRLLYPDTNPTKLLPVRKGGIQHHFWIKAISSVLVWSLLHNFNRSSPSAHLFGPQQPVPIHAAARLQRWALILASYNYKIEYRSTTAHADADSMSRLPLPQTWSLKCENIECFFLEPDIVTNVTSQMIKRQTQVDPVLSKVYNYVISGWPSVIDPTLVPIKNKRDELTTQQGCVLWGTRVVVPPSLQEKVLHELHETHPGISRMKALSRSYVWWPNIDAHIERTISSCSTCQTKRSAPPTAQIHPWIFPARPWSRIHVDFPGPISGHMYMVVVDAYSKFPEVVKMTTTTAGTTITALRDIFSRHGLPEILVSDNGSQFTSR